MRRSESGRSAGSKLLAGQKYCRASGFVKCATPQNHASQTRATVLSTEGAPTNQPKGNALGSHASRAQSSVGARQCATDNGVAPTGLHQNSPPNPGRCPIGANLAHGFFAVPEGRWKRVGHWKSIAPCMSELLVALTAKAGGKMRSPHRLQPVWRMRMSRARPLHRRGQGHSPAQSRRQLPPHRQRCQRPRPHPQAAQRGREGAAWPQGPRHPRSHRRLPGRIRLCIPRSGGSRSRTRFTTG